MSEADQQREAEILPASEASFRQLAETIPQLVWITLADGSVVYCNQRYYAYLHTSFEDVRDFGWRRFLHPDDLERVLAIRRRSLETGVPYETEYRIKEGQTGIYRWFLTRALPVCDANGQIVKWFGTSTDIDAYKRTAEALQESERRFRHLMDSNLLGIAISEEGIIREANQAFLSLLGYSREDLAAGKLQWTILTPPDYQEQSTQAREESLLTGLLQPYEKEYLTKEGKRVPVLLGGTLIRRKPRSLLAFVLDLTARKEVERQKDLFLGMTSHELKTPLAALKGMAQLIQRRMKRLLSTEQHLSPDTRAFFDDLSKHLTATFRQVEAQTRLINDLLDISRITANTLELSVQRCELVSLVRETIEDLRVIAPERSLLLTLPEQSTAHVLADRGRISQVLINYVTNAIRYAPAEQPIQIGLKIQQKGARVWVQDRGPGLSAEAQQDVWQRFHQIKGTPVQSGSGQGLGLGLYICQTLITLHGGTVGVQSTPGEGATFWFTLPLATE